MMNEKDVERLKAIILCAKELDWIKKAPNGSGEYPSMQLSEVEKCMLAMTDDFELERLKRWVEETRQLKALSQLHTDRFGKLYQEKREALNKLVYDLEPKETEPKKPSLFSDIISQASSNIKNMAVTSSETTGKSKLMEAKQ